MIGQRTIERLRALSDMAATEKHCSWPLWRIQRQFTRELKREFHGLLSAAEKEFNWQAKYNELSAANKKHLARIEQLEKDKEAIEVPY